jgi:4-hydroxy-2-oxoheptanedioate aldolase
MKRRTSMLRNPVKDKIKKGEVSYGIWLSWACPDLVEFCGFLGFEWVLMDGEHIPIGRETCTELVRACQIGGIVPIMRVPENNRSMIMGYLDTGVLGIMVPHVNSAEQAKAVVDAVKYSPIGKRGAAVTRAGNYGLTQTSPEYYRQANEATLVIVLVEEVEGIRNLDEILAVEGIDVVSIGPGDLAHSMGIPGQSKDPRVQEMTLEAEARVARAKRAYDVVVYEPSDIRPAIERGALLIGVPDDVLLGSAGRLFLAERG